MANMNNDIKEKVLEGLDLTYKRLLQTKKERNLFFVISDNGKVVKLPARDYN